MVNQDIKELLKGILKKSEPDLDWAQCPSCQEEWSRLMPCTYFDGKTKTDYVCVECGEGVTALPWLNTIHPIPGSTVEVLTRPAFFGMKIPSSKTTRFAFVRYSGIEYRLGWETTKLKVERHDRTPRFFSNIFDAWFHIKRELEKGDPVEIAQGEKW